MTNSVNELLSKAGHLPVTFSAFCQDMPKVLLIYVGSECIENGVHNSLRPFLLEGNASP